jgi:hypothetical protein
MKRFFLTIAMLAVAPVGLADIDCSDKLLGLGFPVRMKTSGKPRTVKWGPVNKHIGEYLVKSDVLQGCNLSFEHVFFLAREDVYFPLLANLLRVVPKDSLKGAKVYAQDGELLGHFSNVVVFERRGVSSFKAYYFQFRDQNGILQRAGKNSLIDLSKGKPFFLLKWEDIRQRILFSQRLEG